MIKVENIEVFNIEGAVRGMRNPLQSFDKSDSGHCGNNYCDSGKCPFHNTNCFEIDHGDFILGRADLELMRKLYKGGTEHRKFARQIFVSMDIVAPDYWFKEFSTYKVGVVENSTSTMHRIHSKEFTPSDFSTEYLLGSSAGAMLDIIEELNKQRTAFLSTKHKGHWYAMIQLLPMSYNYRRTVTMNYENVFTMIHQRSGHKLDEWNDFVEILKSLPYVSEITSAVHDVQVNR